MPGNCSSGCWCALLTRAGIEGLYWCNWPINKDGNNDGFMIGGFKVIEPLSEHRLWLSCAGGTNIEQL